MNVLVLGGSGFVGRHVVAALVERGHAVTIGTRHPRRRARQRGNFATTYVKVRLEALTEPDAWRALIAQVDVVVNCVGILRERGDETYERIHDRAPRALALACAQQRVRRFVHVSALGLRDSASSRFIRSKLNGERAIAASGAASTIVRPSLLDGEGGYGARWLRRGARWPIHLVPSDATGRIAVLDVSDLGEAMAMLCEADADAGSQVIELGGETQCTLAEHLAALRAASGASRAPCFRVPAILARIASHVCDLLHFSPFSFGHLELLRRDNVPSGNTLPRLLNHAPRRVSNQLPDAGLRDAVRRPSTA